MLRLTPAIAAAAVIPAMWVEAKAAAVAPVREDVLQVRLIADQGVLIFPMIAITAVVAALIRGISIFAAMVLQQII
jgi:hypothetical protein